MGKDIIVGLDIGTTKIACFIGQRADDGKIRIIGFGRVESKGVERGVVRNIKDTAASIESAVSIASEQAGVSVEEVYVGIAGQHIKSIQNIGTIVIPSEHKYIEQEDVDRLIEEQHGIALPAGEDIIHVFPQNYVVDGEELGPDVAPVGVAGKQLKSNFHIVTGNTTSLNNIYESVSRAGLTIKNVVLEPIASALATLDDTDREAGVAMVDIGGGTTDIAIFHEGIIRHTCVLPLAGNAITNDIKENCKILRSQAETLKTRFGSCLPQHVKEDDIISIPGLRTQPPREISMRTLAEIIKTRTDTILEQVDYEIKKSHLEKHLNAGIVLTGGGAQLRHIKELTEFNTGLDTRIGLPDEHLAKDTDGEIVNTMYATGIGLVLFGFEELDQMRAHGLADVEPVAAADGNDDGVKDDLFDLPPTPDPDTIFATDVVEQQPVEVDGSVKNDPKKSGDDSKGKGRFRHLLSNSIEKYFNKVFNDNSVQNEIDEEQDF